jgi:uncharacterized protein (DUF2252 family)
LTRSVPRSAFGSWTPSKDRDILSLLAAQERTRLPDLLPIRHERMRATPFGFYRGAAAVMAADLAGLPVTGLRVQVCGDAHLLNFGAYASPERSIVFDVNDFDETLPGPWEWDILRLTASVVVVARGSSFGPRRTNDAALATVASYRAAMAHFASVSPLDVWYDHVELADMFASPPAAQTNTRRSLLQAYAATPEQHAPSLTEANAPRFVDQPPLFRKIPLGDAEAGPAKDVLAKYRATLPDNVQVLLDRYQLRDLAQKVVGVGSVGTRCYVALLQTERGESLQLQLKEADASVWEPYAGPSTYPHHGQRVVAGQRLVQAASDIFLGWTTDAGISYYVRQLHDMKTSFPVTRLGPRDLTRYARLCAWTLAHAHARSGDPQAIANYLGRGSAFDESAAAFATTYADVTEADYRLYCRAVTT